MYKFQKTFSLLLLVVALSTGCKTEPKKEEIRDKLIGIVSRQGNEMIVSDCGSNRYIKLPISAFDSLGPVPYAAVEFVVDESTGTRTVISITPSKTPFQGECKRDLAFIEMLHQQGTVIAVDNNRELKLTVQKDQIDVQLPSGEIIPFYYVDLKLVQDKLILSSSTLSGDFQSTLRVIVSGFPVSEEIEAIHFHCIIELDQKRLEGIYNFQ